MAFSATFAYSIVDRYTARIKVMEKVTQRFKAQLNGMSAASSKFGGRLSKMSSKLANLRTGFAATMLTMGLRGAIVASIDFETIMNKVEAVTSATTVQMRLLREEAKRQGLQTRFSAVQAAEGMEMLGVRGYKTAQILALLPHVLTMATAGDLEMAESSVILTGTLKTFSMGVDQAGRIVDVYALTAANTASNMSDLNSAMKNFGPLGAAAGMQFEEMAALVGALSDKNIMGSAAGTLLMNSIRNLIKPTTEAIEVLQQFGFRKDEVTKASGEIADLTTLLELFEKRGIGVGEIFRIFQVRGAKAVAALRGQVPVIRELMKKYEDLSGAGKTMAEIMEQRVVGSTHRAISAWQGMKKAIGKGLEPLTMRWQKRLTEVFKYVADRPGLSAGLGRTLVALTAILVTLTLVGVVLGTIAAGMLVFGGITAGAFLGGLALAILGLEIIRRSIVMIMDEWEDFKAGFTFFIPFFELAGEKAENLGYEHKYRKILAIQRVKQAENVIRWSETGKQPLGDESRQPLGSAATDPNSAGQVYKVIVETVIKGSIDVNDKTGGQVTATPSGGNVPINVNQGMLMGTWGGGN